ncbi:hypothetical protein LLEC1_01427 [Akanthomyces lecanii]|uniref:HPP transmembrane region domain-containing protein n=1 Tax=Cordyceps confragosa TaxID=2714763 RepID=A0A179I272_CORDF|nr:hypothetical protein LLEC1_01427 [Akanthomyces lecanii]
MPRPIAHHAWNFDIDRFLNPIVPSPPWSHMPYPVAYFLGHRKNKPANTGNLMPTFWAFIGIFCAITIIQVVSKHVPAFESHHVPAIVGSFVSRSNIVVPDPRPSTVRISADQARQGATAVLEFYAIESPLAQPRNTFFGQVLAAVIGVSRRYPVYWWTPESLHAKKPILHRSKEDDLESVPASAATTNESRPAPETGNDAQPTVETLEVSHRKHESNEVIIRSGDVSVPHDMFLTQEEAQLLETLSRRL